MLCFASTQRIFHSPGLGICFVYQFCFGEVMCIWDSYVYQKGVLCFLFMSVMSGRLEVTVLSVIMLR